VCGEGLVPKQIMTQLELKVPAEMKALAIFPKEKEIKIIEVKTPRINRSDQIKLKMLEVGICGTDREISSFEYGTPPKDSDYLILGHEGLGQVIETGSQVRRVRVGDLVVLTVRRPCSEKNCRPCRAGHPDFCVTEKYLERGIKGAHGFMSEYVVDGDRYAHIVPPKLRSVGVLAEPLTIAEKAIDQSASIVRRLPWIQLNGSKKKKYGRLKVTAVVLGAGPVGLLGAMALVAAGSDTYVYALAPRPNPSSDLVESIGGKYYSEGKVPIETRNALMGKVHLIYEATGASQLAFRMLELLGHNSEFVMTGVPSLKKPFEVDGDLLMRNIVLKNQVIVGIVNASSENFDEAIKDLGIFRKRWPKELVTFISEKVPLDEAPEVLVRRSKGIKTVISLEEMANDGSDKINQQQINFKEQ
jgi:glucose 1-dehydrogenase